MMTKDIKFTELSTDKNGTILIGTMNPEGINPYLRALYTFRITYRLPDGNTEQLDTDINCREAINNNIHYEMIGKWSYLIEDKKKLLQEETKDQILQYVTESPNSIVILRRKDNLK